MIAPQYSPQWAIIVPLLIWLLFYGELPRICSRNNESYSTKRFEFNKFILKTSFQMSSWRRNSIQIIWTTSSANSHERSISNSLRNIMPVQTSSSLLCHYDNTFLFDGGILYWNCIQVAPLKIKSWMGLPLNEWGMGCLNSTFRTKLPFPEWV